MNDVLDDAGIPTPTDGDHAAYGMLWYFTQRMGRERMALDALDSGFGTFPVAMVMAAKGASIDEVFDTLRREAGALEESILWPFTPGAQEGATDQPGKPLDTD